MAEEVGVLVVHGMGSQEDWYADDMIKELGGRLKKLGVPSGTVLFEAAYWAPTLIQKQEDLWKALKKDNDLDFGKIRRFFLDSFADAVAYRRTEDEETGVYAQIHERIEIHLQAMRAMLGGDKPSPPGTCRSHEGKDWRDESKWLAGLKSDGDGRWERAREQRCS